MKKKSTRSKNEEKTHKHSRRKRKSSSSSSEVESSKIQDELSEEPKTRRGRKAADKEVENNAALGGRVTRHSRRLAAISGGSEELKEATPELLSPIKTGKSSPYSTGSPVKDARKKDGTPDKHKGKDSNVWTIESANGSGLQKLKIRRQKSPETHQAEDKESESETHDDHDNSSEFVHGASQECSEIVSKTDVDLESIILPEVAENDIANIQLPPTDPEKITENEASTVQSLPDIASQIADDFVGIENIELPPEPEPQTLISSQENEDSNQQEDDVPSEQIPEEIPLPNDVENTDVEVKNTDIEVKNTDVEVKSTDEAKKEIDITEEREKSELVEKVPEKVPETDLIVSVRNEPSPQQILLEQDDGSQAELVLTVEDNMMEEQILTTTVNEEEDKTALTDTTVKTPQKESVLPSMSEVDMEEVYDYEHDDTREEGELSANEAMSPIHEIFKKLPVEERKRSWGTCNVFHFNRSETVADEKILKSHDIVRRVISKEDLESSESEDLVFVKEIREENIVHEIESDINTTLVTDKEYDSTSFGKGDTTDVRRRHNSDSKSIEKSSKRYSKESKTVSGEGKSVLYITNLVRPFTVNQLRELLQRTGKIVEDGFWIDSIKSKCYVQFENEDQATETRHALHGIRWPVNNPKVLSVHFATVEELISAQSQINNSEIPRKTEPLVISNHNNDGSQKNIDWKKHFEQYDERPRKVTDVREWDIGKPAYPDEMMYSEENEFKKKEEIDSTGTSKKDRKRKNNLPEEEMRAKRHKKSANDSQPPAEAKLLDDLFRRTKASPSIYWLPLSEEQISVKQEARRKHLEDIDRQMKIRNDRDPRRRDRERRRSRR